MLKTLSAFREFRIRTAHTAKRLVGHRKEWRRNIFRSEIKKWADCITWSARPRQRLAHCSAQTKKTVFFFLTINYANSRLAMMVHVAYRPVASAQRNVTFLAWLDSFMSSGRRILRGRSTGLMSRRSGRSSLYIIPTSFAPLFFQR